jgi:hypothetical protein
MLFKKKQKKYIKKEKITKKKESFLSDRQTHVQLKTIVRNLTKKASKTLANASFCKRLFEIE